MVSRFPLANLTISMHNLFPAETARRWLFMLWTERPTIHVDLDAPMEERWACLTPEMIAESKRLVDAITEEIPTSHEILADGVRLRTRDRFHPEAKALAKALDVSWRDVILGSLSYDFVLSLFGCTTLVLPTPSGPVIARNMDWWPEALLARSTYLIRYERNGDLVYANAGWPAAIGMVTGLSAKGFAVILNAVSGPEGIDFAGYPVLLFLRRVVEDADGFDEALDMLTKARLAAPGLITLAGTENDQRVVIERSSKKHALRWGENGKPLVTTNDYRKLFIDSEPERKETGTEKDVLSETACGRYDAMCELFRKHDSDRDVSEETLLSALSNDDVIQEITAQHVLICPRRQEMKLYVPTRLLNGE